MDEWDKRWRDAKDDVEIAYQRSCDWRKIVYGVQPHIPATDPRMKAVERAKKEAYAAYQSAIYALVDVLAQESQEDGTPKEA